MIIDGRILVEADPAGGLAVGSVRVAEIDSRTNGRGLGACTLSDGRLALRQSTAGEQAVEDARIVRKAAEAADGLAARRYQIRKITIVRRIQAAGLAATSRTFREANPDLDDLWQAAGPIKGNDPQMIGFLTSIGADLDIILAPEDAP